MFSKKDRIERKTIGKIFKNPDFLFSSENFILRASKNKLKNPRFSVVVPKKVEKGAVKRHFLKRKVVSVLKTKKIKNGLDFVLYLKKDLKNKDLSEINKELDILLKKCIID